MVDRNTKIRGTQIFDNTIEPSKLKALNSPVAGYILEYDETSGEFRWVSGAEAITETPSGLVNGANKVFTVSSTPEAGSLHVYLNGLYQEAGASKDYVISGSDITFVDAPETDDIIIATYFKIEGTSPGDMLKTTYDTNNDGIVDKAEALDDGVNTVSTTDAKDAVDKKHDHSNKALLDTYTQTEADISDAISKEHEHTNSAELDLVSDGDHDVRTDNPHGVDKTDVGLSNVTNDAQIPTSEKGSSNGVAELDGTGKVPSGQLPSYVDDVVEYANLASFPGTGESGIIYVALDTNKTYRWSGSAYTEISESLALGETSATAYRGDRGKDAYDHSEETSGNPHSVSKSDVGLGNVANVDTTDGSIQLVLDGGGSAITVGDTVDIEIPFDCTITQASMLAKESGSIQVDIWVDTYANFPPTDADSITASAVPAISSGVKYQDSTLSGWATSLTKGSVLRFSVDSVTTITRCLVSLQITKV